VPGEVLAASLQCAPRCGQRRWLTLLRSLCCVRQDEAQVPQIAEQPLSESERDQVKRYREIQRFLKSSPFYVRPPRQSEHAGNFCHRHAHTQHRTPRSLRAYAAIGLPLILRLGLPPLDRRPRAIL